MIVERIIESNFEDGIDRLAEKVLVAIKDFSLIFPVTVEHFCLGDGVLLARFSTQADSKAESALDPQLNRLRAADGLLCRLTDASGFSVELELRIESKVI